MPTTNETHASFRHQVFINEDSNALILLTDIGTKDEFTATLSLLLTTVAPLSVIDGILFFHLAQVLTQKDSGLWSGFCPMLLYLFSVFHGS